jgi:hypothetical protein
MTTTPFLPKGMRPPGLHPAAPRVVYKTVRKNLSHAGRIGRIDRVETLNEFHEFSRDFHSRRPRLAPERAGPLHNQGFLPDKGVLFDLDTPGRADQYLSDFQARILPLVNGTRQAALRNRLLFWRLHKASMPMAELLGSVQGGRLVLSGGADPSGSILTRPTLTTDTATRPCPRWNATAMHVSSCACRNGGRVSAFCGSRSFMTPGPACRKSWAPSSCR